MAIETPTSIGSGVIHLLWTFSPYLFVAYVTIDFIAKRFQPGLASIPGPSLASFTKFWRLYDVWKGQAHLTAINLHRRHGRYVRIGPNHVSVSDPRYIPVIYSTKEDFTKTDFYSIQCITWNKQPAYDLFSTCDPVFHRAEKRKVGAAYTLPNLLQSEPAVDSCIDLFLSRLEDLTTHGKAIDVGMWLQYFAFDVVGEVTFATKLGFLEQGIDVDGTIKSIEDSLSYAALCGQVPEYHKYLLGNPLVSWFTPAMETWDQVLLFTLKAINGRTNLQRDGEMAAADDRIEGKDMLSRLLAVKTEDPLKMSTEDIVVHLAANVFAGSDTTAIALRATINFLCYNPSSMTTLLDEISTATAANQLSDPITYKQATTHLPYLDAVIKESMRLHPSVGLIIERHVPAAGLTLDNGVTLPAGTVVGINPWVVMRDEHVFSPDPDVFRPERWLVSETNNVDELRAMETVWEFGFGAGSRKCIGRNISLVEMYKVVPMLLRRFDVRLKEGAEQRWKVQNRWFVQQRGLVCELRKREVADRIPGGL